MLVYINRTQVLAEHPYANLYRIKRYHAVPLELQQHLEVKYQALTAEHAERVKNLHELTSRYNAAASAANAGASNAASQVSALHLQMEQLQTDVQQLAELQRGFHHWRSHPLPGLQLTFGLNIWQRSRYGLFLYCGGRLIEAYVPVGPQVLGQPWMDDGCGGVVGVVELDPQLFPPAFDHNALLSQTVG